MSWHKAQQRKGTNIYGPQGSGRTDPAIDDLAINCELCNSIIAFDQRVCPRCNALRRSCPSCGLPYWFGIDDCPHCGRSRKKKG